MLRAVTNVQCKSGIIYIFCVNSLSFTCFFSLQIQQQQLVYLVFLSLQIQQQQLVYLVFLSSNPTATTCLPVFLSVFKSNSNNLFTWFFSLFKSNSNNLFTWFSLSSNPTATTCLPRFSYLSEGFCLKHLSGHITSKTMCSNTPPCVISIKVPYLFLLVDVTDAISFMC